MLLKTTTDLKTYFSSIDKDYDFASLKSFIDDAEKDILIPRISQELYDVINAGYNSNQALAGKKAQLLDYLQKATVHLALMLSADSGSFRISDSGFYVISNDKNKPVSDKKMAEFKKGRRESGYRAIEQAVLFLEGNINEDDFATYAASTQHQAHKAYFINDSVTFTGYYRKVNNSAYLFDQLLDSIDYAERVFIGPVLGAEYFQLIKTKVLDNSLTAAEKKLLPYINRALANYTIAKALPSLPVEFDGNNITITSMPAYGNSENVVSKAAVKVDQLSLLINDALNTGASYARALEDYLVANSGDFTGYTPPSESTDSNINDPNSPTYFV